MTLEQNSWLITVAAEADAAKHIFPRMAACEAALESNYGSSALAREANNLFGMKQHSHPTFGTLVLPTREFVNSAWIVVAAEFVKYSTLAECFEDRIETLLRLKTYYRDYAAALEADDAETYVRAVSRTWSSDPQRADKCIAIYREAFPAQNNAEAVQDASAGEN